ncbi:MAG: SDR family oxidoreductase [Dehalococcoidia bacterium]|nr:SDR family oxidoreductase [Dehalococcoidia bacterium]
MKRFEGKVALVTGGASGIGRATALAFAKEGAKVVIADIDVAGGEETASMIRDAGGAAIFVKTDVRIADEVKNMADKTVETFGRLDCAFNNAGINEDAVTVSRCAEDSWERMIDTNLTGVFLCMKYELPKMRKSGGGSIVNTASVMGLVGDGSHPAYSSTKHGVVGLTRTAAIVYAQAGIRINAVCPGPTLTPMVHRLIDSQPEVERMLLSHVPMNRMAKPEEIAQAVLFLCSDDASYITGHALAVDGGWVAR